MVKISQKGDFSKTLNFLKRASKVDDEIMSKLEFYGRKGVAALSSATPVDTGLTASSWYYEIEKTRHSVTLRFNNSNIQSGYCNIAVMLQYGHGTKNGGWVEGRDYINPAIRPIFDEMIKVLWEEVIK